MEQVSQSEGAMGMTGFMTINSVLEIRLEVYLIPVFQPNPSFRQEYGVSAPVSPFFAFPYEIRATDGTNVSIWNADLYNPITSCFIWLTTVTHGT